MDEPNPDAPSCDDLRQWESANMDLYKVIANPKKSNFSRKNQVSASDLDELPSPSKQTEAMFNLKASLKKVGGQIKHDNTVDCKNRESTRFRNLELSPSGSKTDTSRQKDQANQRSQPTNDQSGQNAQQDGTENTDTANEDGGIAGEANQGDDQADDQAEDEADEADDAKSGDGDDVTNIFSSSEDELYEKQTVLLELEELVKQNNVRLSKRYTINDDLADIQLEVRRHLISIEEANSIKFMKDAIKVGCTGLEMLNSRMGPFLELDGWSNEVCRDIDRYNSAFSKLHKKYCKRSSMSPEMELMIGLVGSVGMHHFKSKFLTPTIGAKAAPASAASYQSEAKARGGAPDRASGGAMEPIAEDVPPSLFGSNRWHSTKEATPDKAQRTTAKRAPINFTPKDTTPSTANTAIVNASPL